MKALSIHGNYIMDIINGNKTIEYRTWTTNYRGPLLLCASAKKYPNSIYGHAVCVAMIRDIEWNEEDQLYYWHIEPFKKGGSYLIEPIKVKGQLKLYNVDDKLIKPAPFVKVEHSNPKFDEWYNKKIKPLIYVPKRKVKKNVEPKFSKFKKFHIVH